MKTHQNTIFNVQKKISLLNSSKSAAIGFFQGTRGWSGGAMTLGKLPEPGHPTVRMIVGKGVSGACGGCGWALFGHFYSHLSFFSCLSL